MPELSPLHERLRTIAGQRSYRVLGDLTGQNVETVRRYMLGQSPSVEFVSSLCASLGINGHWVLTGRGPIRASDIRSDALSSSTPADLLSAIAGALERLSDRVDRIEKYVQTLETRLRASSPPASPPRADTPPAHEQTQGETRNAPYSGAGAPEDIGARALWIAGALAQRPCADHH